MLTRRRVRFFVAPAVLLFATSFFLCVARPGPTAQQNTPATTALIIGLNDAENLRRVEKLCNGEEADWEIPDFEDSFSKCRLSPNACRRIFRKSILGVAGDFTPAEVELLERCLPNGVAYVETDGLVMKAEGPRPPSAQPLPVVQPEDIFPEIRVKSAISCTLLRIDRGLPAGRLLEREELSTPLELASLVRSPGEKTQDVHVALWNLDRIDQRDLPLDKTYHYGTNTTIGTGKGVTVYVLDSGVNPTHREFQKWGQKGSRASHGYDFVDEDALSEDCDGHGTHVSSTINGRSVGIAKEANVVAVRVLDCEGSGNISTTVAGLDWVAANYAKPAVVALSLGVSIGKWSQSLEDSVINLILEHGITVVVASGNTAVDSCYIAPANVPETITVAASDLDSKFGETTADDVESIYRWSNTGRCVDLFAPGVDIYAACGGLSRCEEVNDEAYAWASGTSMAVPHVAGVAAVYLGDFPGMTPAALKSELTNKSTKDKIFSSYMRSKTPNRLLYSRGMESIVVATDGP